MTTTGDTIGATVGSSARNVAVGKEIIMGIGSGDVSDSDKLDRVYQLIYQTSERVARLETWLAALTVAVAMAGLLIGWRLF